MKLNSTTSQDYSNMFEVENTTHAVPRFRGAHVSQSGAPKGDPHRFQCYNKRRLYNKMIYSKEIIVFGAARGGGALPYKRLKERYATGWGRIFTTGLPIKRLHFQKSY